VCCSTRPSERRAASQACRVPLLRGAGGAGRTCASKAAVCGAAGRHEGERAQCQERAGGGCQAPDALPLPATQPPSWAVPRGAWAVLVLQPVWGSDPYQPCLHGVPASRYCAATAALLQAAACDDAAPPGYVDRLLMTAWVFERVCAREGGARRAQGRGAPAQAPKRVRVRCAGAWRRCGTCGSPCHAVSSSPDSSAPVQSQAAWGSTRQCPAPGCFRERMQFLDDASLLLAQCGAWRRRACAGQRT
jgi:hypothetical protein